MMMHNKKTLIISGVIIAALAIAYFIFFKKKDLSTTSSTDPFDIDDTQAYNNLVNMAKKLPDNAYTWIAPLVKDRYANNPVNLMGTNRKSKAETLYQVIYDVNFNDKGLFSISGKKTLWPVEIMNTYYDSLNALRNKYNSL